MYENDQGVEQDDQQTVKLYRFSAHQGNADAQYRLGMMYVNGEGVPQDDLEAYKWLSLSVSHGDRTAIKARD